MTYKLPREIFFRYLRLVWTGNLASCHCRKRPEYQKACLYGLLFAVTLFAFAATISAQPVMTRGQQILTINYDECLRRAQSAFSSEGWVNIGTSGNAVAGFKGINGSYTVCNPAPDNKMAVNIFVTSSSNDSGVPGAERVRLQARMDQSAAVGCGLGRIWNNVESGLSMKWTRRGNNNIFDVTGSVGGRPFTAEQTIEIRGNKVYVNRYSALDGNTCMFEGTIQSDGKTVTGTYDCTKYKPTSGWRATINCN